VIERKKQRDAPTKHCLAHRPDKSQNKDNRETLERKEVDAYISIKLQMGNRFGEQEKVYEQQETSTFHAWKAWPLL